MKDRRLLSSRVGSLQTQFSYDSYPTANAFHNNGNFFRQYSQPDPSIHSVTSRIYLLKETLEGSM